MEKKALNNDISIRLEKFYHFKDGWSNGRGIAFNPVLLKWLSSYFKLNYPPKYPFVRVFPMVSGNVCLEWWFVQCVDFIVDVNLETHVGVLHIRNIETLDETSRKIDFDSPTDWKFLLEQIESIAKYKC